MSNVQAFRDRLARGGQPDRLRASAFRALDRTQDDPAVQIRGLALALCAAGRAVGVEFRELITTTELMLDDLDAPYAPTIQAIQEYAIHEIGRMK